MAHWEQDEEGGGSFNHRETSLSPEATRTYPFSLKNQAWLQRTIELELVPRLMLAHRSEARAFPDFTPQSAKLPEPADIETLTDLLLRDDEQPGLEFVRSFREREVSLGDVMLNLLAPAARRLGERWTADECDFTQVTLGLWRIQSILFGLSESSPALFDHPDRTVGRILVAAMPGSDHTLGVLMLAEFFRRAGWDVWHDPEADLSDLESALAADRYDLVGLSASQDMHLQQLPAVILNLRRVSKYAGLAVMVGGPLFVDHPERAAMIGADLTASDGPQALDMAQEWVTKGRLRS
jgi:methanogenic corrinoid protein MtbC1